MLPSSALPNLVLPSPSPFFSFSLPLPPLFSCFLPLLPCPLHPSGAAHVLVLSGAQLGGLLTGAGVGAGRELLSGDLNYKAACQAGQDLVWERVLQGGDVVSAKALGQGVGVL